MVNEIDLAIWFVDDDRAVIALEQAAVTFFAGTQLFFYIFEFFDGCQTIAYVRQHLGKELQKRFIIVRKFLCERTQSIPTKPRQTPAYIIGAAIRLSTD